MSKGNKTPHNKSNIPTKNNSYDEKKDPHINDNKHISADTHGIKGKSSTRSPSHTQ